MSEIVPGLFSIMFSYYRQTRSCSTSFINAIICSKDLLCRTMRRLHNALCCDQNHTVAVSAIRVKQVILLEKMVRHSKDNGRRRVSCCIRRNSQQLYATIAYYEYSTTKNQRRATGLIFRCFREKTRICI